MFKRSALRLYATLAALVLLAAAPARAQFQPRTLNDPATGEQFHIEGSVGFWMPTSDMTISSESLGIAGTPINFKTDLGLQDQRFRELHLVLRPARKHKFRFQFIPIRFEQDAHKLTRDIVFNGQKYSTNSLVNSVVDWKAYRFGYEYDFLSKNRWYAGVVVDAKYTDVSASLRVSLPAIDEYFHDRLPIPSIGGIGRFYIVPNISITGELTLTRIPESVGKEFRADGHYTDLDIYGTMNFTNNIGVMGGYRSFDVGYHVEDDLGNFTLKGVYLGIVARY